MTDLAEKTGKVMQQDTMKHVALAIMDPDTKEKMLDHLAEDSYEELKARVFKYLVHVKGITYEAPKTWGAHLNSTSEGGARSNEGGQENPQDQDCHEDNWWGAWNPQETLSALMALKGKGKGKAGGKGGGACYECGQTGHFGKNCPNVTCYECGGKGHRSYDCPEKGAGKGGAKGYKGAGKSPPGPCPGCGGNHWKFECPRGGKKGGGKTGYGK